jgi:hypothetical protein
MLIGTYDGLTGEQAVREATPEEIAEREAEILAFQVRDESRAEALSEITTARQAILDRLGLTSEEAQLILGGSN